MKTKIIQITAGRGPAECSWVVAQVLKRFLDEVKAQKMTYTILQRTTGTENGTIQSVTIKISGAAVTAFLSTWLGTIQWIGSSTIRKYHKRKNWFIGCYALEQFQEVTVSEKDMRFQAMRSSGPGGQNVNKVNSAVRAIHAPTGIQVVAMDSRSQHQNRKLAVERLKEKVGQTQLEDLKKSLSDQWENHLNVTRGNPIRIFKGTDFKRQITKKTYKSKRQELKNDLKKQQWD